MDLFKFIIDNIMTVLTIITTVYSIYLVKVNKFFVVEKDFSTIIRNREGIKLKFNDFLIHKNLYYFRLFIVYYGETDVRKDDVEVPFTITSRDENCKFYQRKVKLDKRQPNVKVWKDKNRMIISSGMLKKYDSVELEFYIEANTYSLDFTSRLFNVDKAIQSYDVNNVRSNINSTVFWGVITTLCTIAITILANETVTFLSKRDAYVYEYNYLGNEIPAQFYKVMADYTMDTTYFNNNREKFQVMKDGMTFDDYLKGFDKPYIDSAYAKPRSHLILFAFDSKSYFSKEKLPSGKADSIVNSNQINGFPKIDQFFKIDKDTKFKVISNKFNFSSEEWAIMFGLLPLVFSLLYFYYRFLQNLKLYINIRPILSAIKKTEQD